MAQLNPQTLSPEIFATLQKAFEDFQLRAEKLDRAYRAMQVDFKKLNIELDRKNRELAESLNALKETQTYLNSILQSMHNGVIGVDILGTITQFNRAAGEITGNRADAVLNTPYERLYARASQSDETLLRVLRTGKESALDEKVIWHADGHPVPVSFQTALLRDGGGNALGAVEIFTDLTRIKALEQEMQQAKKMAVLGEMSATVAHEIRNPLGAMAVWAGLLDRDLPDGDPRKRHCSKIVEGLGRLNKIVTNLLVYARPVKADLRKVAVHALMEEIADVVATETQRQNPGVRIHKVWDAAPPAFILADPEKIQQIVMNLCINAVQAMPGGGTLTIAVDRPAGERADYVCFSVSDTGTGIESANLEKIFDPFFTTKEDGTGLGLAIVKKLVELHSGFIDVKSAVGTGTTVRVFLPRSV